MNPQEEIPEEDRPRAYYNQPVWKRIVVIGAGPSMNIVLAFLILFVAVRRQGRSRPTTARSTRPDGLGRRRRPEARRQDRLGRRRHAATPTKLRKQIGTHTCANGGKVKGCVAATPATVVVDRDGRPVDAAGHPALLDPDDEAAC